MMEYRTLGSSGASVSTLALGTMTFGTETDEAGLRTRSSTGSSRPAATWSTPPTSTATASREQIIGRWLADRPPERRDQVVLATKGRFPMGDGPQRRRPVPPPPAARARRLAAPARRRLDRPVPGARLGPADPARGDAALPRRRRARRARSTTSGCPTSPAGSCSKAVDVAEHRGLARPVTLQPQYNLLVREIEWEIVPGLPGQRARPAALVAAGRRLADRQVPTRRAARPARPGWARTRSAASRPTTGAAARERTWDVVDAVREVADEPRRVDGAGGAGLAGRPAGVTSVILGARTTEQLDDNLGAAGLHLVRRRDRPARRGQRPGAGRLPLRRPGSRAAISTHRRRLRAAPVRPRSTTLRRTGR